MSGLVGGILIGGKSRRMGAAKHLLQRGGRTQLERTAGLLAPLVEEVVVLGAGELPAGCPLRRLPDWKRLRGPLAGVRAGLAHAAPRGLLIVACDLPDLNAAALAWLIAARRGAGVVPVTPDGRVQPLLAIYEADLIGALDCALAGAQGPPARMMATLPDVTTLPVPEGLASAWGNANTPEDWRSAGGGASEHG